MLEVLLVGIHESINPRQPGLLAMVGMENNRDAIKGGNLAHVLGTSNTSSDGCPVVGVVNSLSGNELPAALGEGDHDGSTILSSSLDTGIDRVSSNNVDSRDGESDLLGSIKEIKKGRSRDNTGLNRGRELGESLNE